MDRRTTQPAGVEEPRGFNPVEIGERSKKTASAAPSDAERWALRGLLARLGNPPIRVRLWNGEEISAGGASAAAPQVCIDDRRTLWRLIVDPDIHFGEA